MTNHVILARASCGRAALFVNQAVVMESSSADIDETAGKLSAALGVPLVECTVEAPSKESWTWPDLLTSLPPLTEQIAKKPFVVYCWDESGTEPDTHQGPGDHFSDIAFDFEPPVVGTPYYILSPARPDMLEFEARLREKALEGFRHWLNDRRDSDVSVVFHETVAQVERLLSMVGLADGEPLDINPRAIHHWSVYEEEPDAIVRDPAHTLAVIDERESNGRVRLHLSSSAGELLNELEVLADISGNPLNEAEHVPALHVHVDLDDPSVSLYKVGDRLLMRLGRGVDLKREGVGTNWREGALYSLR